jgi:nucleoside-diphosphate-sugar epimerase
MVEELPEDDPQLGWHMYGASKVLCERLARTFMETKKPGFALNVLIPECVGSGRFRRG